MLVKGLERFTPSCKNWGISKGTEGGNGWRARKKEHFTVYHMYFHIFICSCTNYAILLKSKLKKRQTGLI